MKKNGFTLIETLVAIFILTLTIGGLLTLAANGYFSVRYSKNQIVADNLLQESLEYLHNSRDTAAQQGISWTQWTQSFNVSDNGTVLNTSTPQGCFSNTGCIVDPYSTNSTVRACDGLCPYFIFSSNGYYGYDSSSYPPSVTIGTVQTTTYRRTITMTMYGSDQMVATATIQWLNGNAPQSDSQSVLFTNWK